MVKYEPIDMEVIAFDTENVIVTSNPYDAGNTGVVNVPKN